MTIYRERANGRLEFWFYSDGDRHYISEQSARKELARGARLVTL